MFSNLLALFVLSFPRVLGLVRPDGIGKLPALGWNSWNAYHCDVSEAKVLAAANYMVALGLKDAGYEYVNIDDCWSVKAGRGNSTGNVHRILPNMTTFPDGIIGTADKVHALGLKIGIYSSAGTETCAGYPASIGYESLDAETFAGWGVDYLKYDNCNVPQNWTDEYVECLADFTDVVYDNGTCPGEPDLAPAGYNWTTSNTAERYRIMRDALEAQNRTILYSLCEWGTADVEEWSNATANSWRMSGDIDPSWSRITNILNQNSFLMDSVDFWGHNDADMLEVGNGDLTLAEERSHFALWAAMKSPLIIGTDLSDISTQLLEILKNRYLLAFSQDTTYGKPATPYKWGVNPDWTFNASNPAEYWAGASSNGTLVLMLNTLNEARIMRASWAEIPGLEPGAMYEVMEVWTGKNMGTFKGGYNTSVDPHDTAVILVQEFSGSSSIGPSSTARSGSQSATGAATSPSASTPTAGSASGAAQKRVFPMIFVAAIFNLAGFL